MSARPWRDGPIRACMAMQLVIWAGLFYSNPALVLHWQVEFGWSTGQVMGAFTLAIAIYALGSPLFGRLIDRGLAPLTFPGGAVAGALLLLALTRVEGLAAFYAIWAGIGVCMGLTLYEATFAVVTRARGAEARQAITAITLVAGFASTLAYPLTGWVAGIADWRAAVWVMAALILAVNLPLSLWAIPRLEAEARGRAPVETAADPAPAPRGALWHVPAFWRIAAAFALAGFATGAVLSLLLPIMAAQGVTGALALTAAALVGPSQVAGRVAMMTLAAQAGAVRIAQLAMACLAFGAAMLGAAAWVAVAVLVFAVAQGAGYGVVGILRAVITREVLGERDFGAVAGAVALPTLLAFALAPAMGALIADLAGFGPVIAICVAAPLLSVVILGALPRRPA